MVLARHQMPARQRGYRYPRHTAVAEHGGGLGVWIPLAAIPLFGGESVDVQDYQWDVTTAPVSVETGGSITAVSMYAVLMPYDWFGAEAMGGATDLAQMLDQVQKASEPTGGDPSTGVGGTEDWVGEHEGQSGVEVLYEEEIFLRPTGLSWNGTAQEMQKHGARSGRLTSNYYVSRDAVLIWALRRGAGADDNTFGVELIDASATLNGLIEAMTTPGQTTHDAAALAELIYGGDHYGLSESFSAESLFIGLSVATRIKTPYPFPGSEWS